MVIIVLSPSTRNSTPPEKIGIREKKKKFLQMMNDDAELKMKTQILERDHFCHGGEVSS